MAGDAQIGFRAGGRLGDRTLSDEFAASGDDGWRGVYAAPAYAKITVAGRVEYMNDRNGLYTSVPQSLKEATLTADYKMGAGFMLRWEWRRDQSNHPYFYTDALGLLANHQTTATVGLIWWFGPKQGAW